MLLGISRGLGLTIGGSIVCWGDDDECQDTPTSGQFQAISAGNYHSLGLTTDGQIVGWGMNFDYQANSPSGQFQSIAAGRYHSLAIVVPTPPDPCDLSDLAALYAVLNTSTSPTSSQYDLNSDNVIDTADLTQWLSMAAAVHGHGSPYLRGDTDLDRDIDLTDYNSLVTNFDPSGTYGPYLWQHGNSDGDNDVDLADYNAVASNFQPLGYGAAPVPEPTSLCLLLGALLLLARVRF